MSNKHSPQNALMAILHKDKYYEKEKLYALFLAIAEHDENQYMVQVKHLLNIRISVGSSKK